MHRARRGPVWRWPLVIGSAALLLGALALAPSSRDAGDDPADGTRTVVPLALPSEEAAKPEAATSEAAEDVELAASARAATPALLAESASSTQDAARALAAASAPETTAAPDAPAPTAEGSPAPVADGEAAPAGAAGDPAAARPAPVERHDVRVAEGESLYVIFKRHGLSQADMLSIVRLDRRTKALSRLRPGQRLIIAAEPEGRIDAIALERRDGRALLVRRERGRFASDVVSWDALPARLLGSPTSAGPATASVAPIAGADVQVELQTIALRRVEGEPAVTRSELDAIQVEEVEVEDLEVEEVRFARVEDASAPAPVATSEEPAIQSAGYIPQAVTVGRGDSLYAIFRARGLRVADLPELLSAGTHAKGLTRLRPGQNIEVHADETGAIGRLVVPLDELRTLHLERGPEGFRERVVDTPVEHRQASASGSIESSLFLAGQRAGLTDKTIMELGEIFGWDVDFALDIRSGDRFSVIYEERYVNGEKRSDGPILAAQFVNRGRVLRAVRFVDPDGHAEYYSPDGKSMRKAFLRSPVNFTRISSRFSHGRRHPILHRIRAHRGVDYAAPRGTPVRAAGDGRVEFAGRRGGYGKTVVIQHGSARSTLYAHLSRYGRGIKRGRRVRQGQVIGYVGTTGLATGPHLHYEFRVRGVHKDPLRIKLPPAAPIAKSLAADFRAQSAPLLARLDTVSRTVLAVRD